MLNLFTWHTQPLIYLNLITSRQETLPKISIAWVGCTNVTDRQTDGRTTTYSELAKNYIFSASFVIIYNWNRSNYRHSMPLYEKCVIFGAKCSRRLWNASIDDVWCRGLSLAMSLSSFFLSKISVSFSHGFVPCTHKTTRKNQYA